MFVMPISWPGPGGPMALRLHYLWGNSELFGNELDAFYVGLASCRGVSEGIPSSIILQLHRGMSFEKWHLGFMKVLSVLVAPKLFCTNTQHQEEVFSIYDTYI
jgi:hypothetical protein